MLTTLGDWVERWVGGFLAVLFTGLILTVFMQVMARNVLLIPAMKKAGYSQAFSVASTAASSTLGVIIPPSIIMIVYGAFGNVSIGALFLGGTVLNPISAVLIFLPIIQGLGDTAEMNPVYMGVLTSMVLSVGLIPPPYGICLLIAAQIGDVPLGKAMWAVTPIVGLTVLIAIGSVFFPEIILAFPKLAYPNVF